MRKIVWFLVCTVLFLAAATPVAADVPPGWGEVGIGSASGGGISDNDSGSEAASLANEVLSPFDVIFVARPPGEDIYVIWGSDGTEAGTQLIKNIRPGQRADIGPHKGFVKVNSIFLFAANDGVNGRELWRTDGTTEGTYMLKDLNDGRDSSNISDYDFVTMGPKAFFFVDNDNYGGSEDELWVSDGTAEGTQLVSSFARVGGQTMAIAGNRIFFTADDGSGYGGELWVSDGTAEGTYMVKDINPGSDWSNPWSITGFGDKVVFACDDGIHGKEPWISDGTETGTYMIEDQIVGSESPDPRPFTTVGSKVVFASGNPSVGRELYVTDGTPGSAILIDIQPGSGSSVPHDFTTIDNKLWFTADDGIHGREPWNFDGTTATMLKDINPGSADGTPLSLRVGFAKGHDDRIYFGAQDSNGVQPWVSDGTEVGTQMLKYIYVDSAPAFFTPANSITYFAARDWPATGYELWKTDGTEAGTVLVKDIWPGTGSSYPRKITFVEPISDSDGDGILDPDDKCPLEDATGLDADKDGCIDTAQQLTDLINDLPSDALADEVTNSLTQQVSNAQKQATKENICAAVKILGAFQNEVEAQREKKITDATATLLIEYANNLIAQLLENLAEGETC